MKKLHLKNFSRSEVPIHSKEKGPPRPRIWDSQHSFVATKNPKNKKNDFLENFYTKMKLKFYEIFRENSRRYEKFFWKIWKFQFENVKNEKEREKGIWENILRLLRKTG